jgi:hypothetical protein
MARRPKKVDLVVNSPTAKKTARRPKKVTLHVVNSPAAKKTARRPKKVVNSPKKSNQRGPEAKKLYDDLVPPQNPEPRLTNTAASLKTPRHEKPVLTGKKKITMS